MVEREFKGGKAKKKIHRSKSKSKLTQSKSKAISKLVSAISKLVSANSKLISANSKLVSVIEMLKINSVFIGVIASFKKMKRLVKDLAMIEAALRTSTKLVVSKDGKKVKRLHPVPLTEKEKDTKACTIIAENLPDDYSKENLEKIFANAGKILNITIHDPHSVEESNVKTTLSTKSHALIVYETAEAAANAASTLNNGKSWRSGMRVEVLQKWMGKYGVVGKRHKEADSEKSKKTAERNSDSHVSKFDPHLLEKSEKEGGNQLVGGKGNHRDRHRKGRGQQNTTGLGHGQSHQSSIHGVSKPPPGPKMPDGTRGFTIGRGKSFVSPPN